jgi:23S rRNA (uracil1939-C5)-methyltransferase
VPQIEVAVGSNTTILIFRVLELPSDKDRQLLSDYAANFNVAIYLQSGGPNTVEPLNEAVELYYELPEYDLKMDFLPDDFTQVNVEMNKKMLAHAIQLLDVQAEDKVLDLFCGLGNFTLPLARLAKEVVGVEGDAGLVQRARDNATKNGIDNTRFYTANLYEKLDAEQWLLESFDKVLLDPPRSGAAEILPEINKLSPSKIVYVSCYPGTLARDAGILVNDYGYKLISAGVMDMFPHTGHVESIALFEK